MRKALLLLMLAGLQGCVLSPQTIQLNNSMTLEQRTLSEPQGALVRVLDQRGVDENVIGHRGGRLPENSPLLIQSGLKSILTRRLQDSLMKLGFGSSAEASADPIKVQLSVIEFAYQCNEGIVVNKCSISVNFNIQITRKTLVFNKPYNISEERNLVASPAKEYNQKWVNETLDRLWKYMFEDKELRSVLTKS